MGVEAAHLGELGQTHIIARQFPALPVMRQLEQQQPGKQHLAPPNRRADNERCVPCVALPLHKHAHIVAGDHADRHLVQDLQWATASNNMSPKKSRQTQCLASGGLHASMHVSSMALNPLIHKNAHACHWPCGQFNVLWLPCQALQHPDHRCCSCCPRMCSMRMHSDRPGRITHHVSEQLLKGSLQCRLPVSWEGGRVLTLLQLPLVPLPLKGKTKTHCGCCRLRRAPCRAPCALPHRWE